MLHLSVDVFFLQYTPPQRLLHHPTSHSSIGQPALIKDFVDFCLHSLGGQTWYLSTASGFGRPSFKSCMCFSCASKYKQSHLNGPHGSVSGTYPAQDGCGQNLSPRPQGSDLSQQNTNRNCEGKIPKRSCWTINGGIQSHDFSYSGGMKNSTSVAWNKIPKLFSNAITSGTHFGRPKVFFYLNDMMKQAVIETVQEHCGVHGHLYGEAF